MRNLLNNWSETLSVAVGVLATISTVVGAWLLRGTGNRAKAEYSSEVEAIASAVKAIAPSSGETREEEWEVVRRLVKEYHSQALSQAKVQFWFSVVAASSGFAIIIVAIVMALMKQTSASQTILQVVPGIAIEAVAALFFKQAAETRERATALYDRLRTDRERTYALSLVDSIDNSNLRNAVKAELALHMAGLVTSPLAQMLPALLGSRDILSQALPNAVEGLLIKTDQAES
jgi:hypothetical protein